MVVVGHGSMFHGIVSSRSVMYRVSERHNLLAQLLTLKLEYIIPLAQLIRVRIPGL
jgi:hypothetical protein